MVVMTQTFLESDKNIYVYICIASTAFGKNRHVTVGYLFSELYYAFCIPNRNEERQVIAVLSEPLPIAPTRHPVFAPARHPLFAHTHPVFAHTHTISESPAHSVT